MIKNILIKQMLATFLFCFALSAIANDKSVLHDFNDKPAYLSDYVGKGKWLVVMYWASDCHVCNMEAKHYANFHINHKEVDATVLGISLDGAAKKTEAEDFIKRHKITFPNLIGEADDVTLHYIDIAGGTSFGTPSFLLYNPQGKLKAAQLGAVSVKVLEDYIEKNSK